MTDTGPRLLLTRPEPAARRFLAACEAALGERLPAILSPVMTIRPVAVALEEVPAALILTSEHGAAQAEALGLRGLPAWCVGPRTGEAARLAGLAPIAAGPDAEGLLTALLAARPQGPLLHLRGEHARGNIAPRLRDQGLAARDAVAYRQAALPPTPEARAALDADRPLVAPLFSPRSAALLAAWTLRAPLSVVALSPAVAAAAAPLRPAALCLAATAESAGMVEATLRALALSLPRPGPIGGPRLEPDPGAD